MRVLRRELGVTTLVDLRSSEEIQEFGQAPILAGATFVEHKRASSGWSGWLTSAPAKMEEHVQVLEGDAKHQPFTIHHLSILNKKRFYVALAQRLPARTIAQALVTSLWNTQASSDLIMDQVNKGGLMWLYEILLDTSALEFGTALKVIKATLEKGERAMIYCKAGKDRTGLLVMLLLHIAGASEDEILDDYHRSDSYHKMALGGLEKKEELKKLDTEVFSKAPKEAMHHALTHIRQRYGTVDDYLLACGLSSAEQAALKQLLTSR